MKANLIRLAACAREVAQQADCVAANPDADRGALHTAMLAYRGAAVGYIAHHPVADYIRLDALKYSGETRDALERIAKLIDQLEI